ncbi:MAG: hypothetical protein ACT4QC_14400 [Planctomycetaceae bacterium]
MASTKRKSDDSPEANEFRKRFESCEAAFKQLSKLNVVAIPVMLEHLDDKRQSINFRNHYLANSVGAACYWNIYFQLQDRPENYSSYGYKREGRDLKPHPKPYWQGTPFDDAGGLKKWFDQHKHLTCRQMQIECLTWLLEEEKEIGACNPDSYFENILPLEVRILERRQDSGDNVERDLTEARKVLVEKDAAKIPKELLPDR